MKLIFAGTPAFAASALEALIAAGHEIVLVLTQPDRPAGRGMKLAASAVKRLAEKHGLPLYQPARLKEPASHGPILAAQAEAMVVAAYGLILPQAVLDAPRRGCINIHASLLPRWRGAAPIQRALLAGDSQTGISIMQMDAGLDTGPVLLQRAIDIADVDSAATLHDRLAALGAEMIVTALAELDRLSPTPQPEAGATYATKLDKAEAALAWSQPATALLRQIRAFDPFPGATATYKETPLKIWRAELAQASGEPGRVIAAERSGIVVACGLGALTLLELQRPGGKRLPAGEFLRGLPILAGDSLS